MVVAMHGNKKQEIAGLEFNDVSDELYREYTSLSQPWRGYVVPYTLKIENPKFLNVSASGGHRVITGDNETTYVQPNWVSLRWVNKEGTGPLQF